MKTKIEIMTLTLVLALFAGCVSTDGSRDEFFGYSNNSKPKERVVVVKERVIEREVPAKTKQQWKNPLAEDEYNATDNEQQYATSSPSAGYVDRNYVSTRYVPVIVPWWDRYSYDYMYYDPGFHISYYSGGWWGSDWCWYNPWYDYHPYWGNRWYPYNNYGHWWHDPYYSDNYRGWDVAYHNQKPRSVRTFGPYRGSYGKTTTSGNNVNNPQRTLSTTSRSGYVTEKPYSGNMQSTRSAVSGNRSTYLPSSTTRSTYTRQSNDYNKSNSGQKVRTTNSRTNQGSNRNEATQERSRYTPQSSSPNSSRSSEGNTRSSGNAERSTYTAPPAPSGNSSGSRSSGSSGSSGSSRSSSGSSGSSSTGRSSRSK